MGVGLALATVACTVAFDEDLLQAGGDAVLVTDASHGPDAARRQGSPCGSGGQCASGFCVDGVCCDEACRNSCHLCNTSGDLGRCKAAVAGADPRGECSEEAESTCGRDGMCDGSGACRLWSASTVCGAVSCAAPDKTSAKLCDGKGTCVSKEISCNHYACDTTAGVCFTSCSSDAQCHRFKCDIASARCLTACQATSDCQAGYTCTKQKCK